MKKKLACFFFLIMILFSSISISESSIEQLQELYASAELKMATGDYSGAAALFDSLSSYSDSSQMAMYCKAISAAEDYGMYEIAIDAFTKLGEFKDSSQLTVYYTGRSNEAAVDSVIENIANCPDDLINEAKSSINIAKMKYSELALFKDCLTRLSSCDEKEKALDAETAKRNEANLLSIYNTAKDLEDNKQYEEAITIYTTIQDYKDASSRIDLCKTKYKEQKYVEAESLRERKKWEEAIAAFGIADDFSDAKEQILVTRYLEGLDKKENKDYVKAAKAFSEAGNYSDAVEQCKDSWYLEGFAKRSISQWNEAITAFQNAGDYKDAKEQIIETNYLHAQILIEKEKYIEAYNILSLMLDYKDVEKIISENQYLDEIRNSVLRFDGIYICHVDGDKNKFNRCLRFYEDGEVIDASVSGFPKSKWFNRDNKEPGSFVVDQYHIDFTLNAVLGQVVYSGNIVGKKLMLTVFSSNAGTTSELEYIFYPYDDIPNWYAE